MSLRAGDPVMLVWACCSRGRAHVGWTGPLEAIWDGEVSPCSCGHISRGKHGYVTICKRGVVPLSWLRKMPPPGAPAEGEQQPAELEV